MPGAVIAGILWVIALRFFSWYTATVVNYSIIYGSLGGLVLLILWFNYSAQILLIGAEISALRVIIAGSKPGCRRSNRPLVFSPYPYSLHLAWLRARCDDLLHHLPVQDISDLIAGKF